jgi:hypothetical protein
MPSNFNVNNVSPDTVVFNKKELEHPDARHDLVAKLQKFGVFGVGEENENAFYKFADGVIKGDKKDGQVTYGELQALADKVKNDPKFANKFWKKTGGHYLTESNTTGIKYDHKEPAGGIFFSDKLNQK